MAVDTSAYNQPIPNPLASASNGLAVANQAGQNQALALSNQLTRAKLALGEVIRGNTDENGQTDWNSAYSSALDNPLTRPAASIIGEMRDNALTPSEYKDASGTTQYRTEQQRQQELTGTPANKNTLPQDKIDAIHDNIDAHDDAVTDLLNRPNLTKNDALGAAKGLVTNGVMSPNSYVEAVKTLPEDPTELKAHLLEQKAGISKLRNNVLQNAGPHSSQIANPVNNSGPAPGTVETATNKLQMSQKNYQDVQTAASGVPLANAAYNEVINLNNQGALTGTKLADAYQQLAKTGVVPKGVTDEAGRTQEISKWIGQGLLAGGMPGSDARLAQLQSSTISPSQLSATIKELAPYFKATEQGANLKQKFYNKVTGNGADFSQEPQAKQLWDENYDPRFIEFNNLPSAKEKSKFLEKHPDLASEKERFKVFKELIK